MGSDEQGHTQVADRPAAVRDPEGRFARGDWTSIALPPGPKERVRTPQRDPEPPAPNVLATAAITLAMVLVTLVMCVGVPVGAFFVTFAVLEAEPGFGTALLALLATVVGVVACMKVQVRLQRLQCRLASIASPHAPSGWLKSLCDDREGRPASLLDSVVTWATVLALLGAGVWYFGFAAWNPMGG